MCHHRDDTFTEWYEARMNEADDQADEPAEADIAEPEIDEPEIEEPEIGEPEIAEPELDD
jgi:hypothetical protein